MGKANLAVSTRRNTDKAYNLNYFWGQSFTNNFKAETWLPPKAWWDARSQHLETSAIDVDPCFLSVDFSVKAAVQKANQTNGWHVVLNTVTPYSIVDDGTGAGLGAIIPGLTFLDTLYTNYRVTSVDCTLVFTPNLSTVAAGTDGIIQFGAVLSSSNANPLTSGQIKQGVEAGLYQLASLRINSDRGAAKYPTAVLKLKNLNIMAQFQAENALDRLDPKQFTSTLGATQAAHGTPTTQLFLHPFSYVKQKTYIVSGATDASISVNCDVYMKQTLLLSNPVIKLTDT